MPKFEYRADGGYGYGVLSGSIDTGSEAAAQKQVFRKLATQWTTAKRYPDMDARVNKVREILAGNSLSLTDSDTGKRSEWGISDGWQSEDEIQAKRDADKRRHQEDEKRGYRVVDGVILPPGGMELYPVVDGSGRVPAGSSGFAHYGGMEDDATTIRVSDAATTGRFWPAYWDAAGRRWVVTGAGSQWKGGAVVETFPVAARRKLTYATGRRSTSTRHASKSRSRGRSSTELGTVR